MSKLSLSLLGSIQVTLDGEPVAAFESDKVRALLFYLAVEAERPHRREKLAGLLWPERPERNARQNLSQALSNLRRAICDRGAAPPFLIVVPQTVQFDRASDYQLDVAVFDALLDACHAHVHHALETCDACVQRLQQAAALYRGSFLEGFSLRDSAAFEEWALYEQERLQRRATETLRCLTDCHERWGEIEQALRYARRQIGLDPWCEEAHRQVMRLLAYSGQRGAALAQYETCRRLLEEELGVEPGPKTTQLYQELLAGEVEAPAREPVARHNLPLQPTPFVGRTTELAGLAGLVSDPDVRLVTVVGAGGMGKTRLALEAAAGQLERYPHGVFFVRLGPLQTVEEIVPTVARALGFSFYDPERTPGQEKRAPRQQLLDYVRQKRLLLLLDNFEHLLDGAELVNEVLKIAPGVKILATSRARLNLRGEHLYHLSGMRYPCGEAAETRKVLAQLRDDGSAHGAVRLFLSAARQVRADFELSAGNLADVVRICRLVDGMPLGLLLAAAWVELLTPAEIAAEIEGGLDFLATGLRDVPDRQRSVRAAFDHSWRLLGEREREVLAGLSVFRGGFTRQAAQAVTGAALRELMALVDRSLVSRDETGRYQMHELLRQYAAERLHASPQTCETVRERHAAHYSAGLREWYAALKGPRQQAALAELDVEIENARTAWDWAAEQRQVERLDQALEGLVHFYAMRFRPQEGEAACRLAAEKLKSVATDDASRVLAHILAWQANFSRELGGAALTESLLERGRALLESPALAGKDTRRERAFILRQMGHTVFKSDVERSRQLYEHSLALYRAVGDRWWTANALDALVKPTYFSGEFVQAYEQSQECLTIRESLGDSRGVAEAVGRSGYVAGLCERFDEAENFGWQNIALQRELGDQTGVAFSLFELGLGLTVLGRFEESIALIEESAEISENLGFHDELIWSRLWLGYAHLLLGEYDQAETLMQAAPAHYQDKGDMLRAGESLSLLGALALAQEDDVKAAAWLRQSVDTLLAVGIWHDASRALAKLGVAVLRLGELEQARQCLRQSLQLASEITHPWILVHRLLGTALWLAEQGEHERAVELYALASQCPLVSNSRWFEDVYGRRIEAVAAGLPPDVVTAVQERGRTRDLVTTTAELLVELGG